MNFSDGSRGWKKSKVPGGGGAGGTVLRENGWLGAEGRDRETCPSTLEQQNTTLFSFFWKSHSSHAEELQGSDKPAMLRCYYFNGYRTGWTLYFHQGFLHGIFFPLQNIQFSSDIPPHLSLRNVSPFLIPLGWGGNKALLEVIGLSLEWGVWDNRTCESPPLPTLNTLFCIN